MRKIRIALLSVLCSAALLLLSGCALLQERNILTLSALPQSGVISPVSPVQARNAAEMTHEELLALAEMPWITELSTVGCTDYDAMLYLREFRPDLEVHWTVPLGSAVYSETATSLKVNTTEGLMEALHALPEIKTVDLCSFRPDPQELDALIETYPDISFLFWVRFAEWTVRSDITCFSSLRPSWMYEANRYTSEDYAPLFKYCTKLRALDLGHNLLTDVSGIGNLTELRALILVDNQNITDISFFEKLENLEYLEFFLNWKKINITSLYGLTKMRYLNLCNVGELRDISFVENMPELEMLWINGSPIPGAQVSQYRQEHPEVTVHYGCPGSASTCHGWRQNEANYNIRLAFRNWYSVNNFVDLEEIHFDPDELVYPEYEP